MLYWRGMRNAYALLGFSFLLVFVGAYLLVKRAQAPTTEDSLSSAQSTSDMELSSSAFNNNESIPVQFTCDGENISPPLSISDAPLGTASFVLVMDDPDIPQQIKDSRGIEKFNHWSVYGLPADTTAIKEGTTDLKMGLNGRGEAAYTGPCPPADMEPLEHRYIFRVYALPQALDFAETPTLDELEQAAQAISLGTATLIGRYSRQGE